MSSILPKNKLENFNFCPSLQEQKFFVRFLEELKTPKWPFEIIWPLPNWHPQFLIIFRFTPHTWSTSSQKATSIATNYIKFSSFLWAFTCYHFWKEWCGSKSYIFKNLMNYFLKLMSALIGGKSIFTKKSFTRFSLQSECSNFN